MPLIKPTPPSPALRCHGIKPINGETAMSDPYIPNTSSTQTPGADRYGNPTRAVPPTVSVQQSGGSGFGTGAMVAIVFVIVALLAAVFLYPRSGADIGQPAVTIENDNGAAVDTAPVAPDAAPVDPAAPAATAPDAAVPEAVAPDAAAPDAAAPVAPAAPPAP